jgi:hypothetical protein
MTRIILTLLIVLPQFLGAQDKEAILKILDNQVQSWNKGDLDQFMVGYWNNDSLMFIGSSGINHGYQEALNHYKKAYSDTAKMGKLRFELIELKQLSPDYYHVTGKFFLKRSVGDLNGVYTLLFHKIRGVWVIVSDHSSSSTP